MIFHTLPEQFAPRFDVVSCFVEQKGKILLLHRCAHKLEGGKWGAPAGKIDPGESTEEALVREVYEETGINLRAYAVECLGKIYVRYPEYDFIYHQYKTVVEDMLEVKINPKEHEAFRWQTPQEAIGLDLVTDFGECIKMHYGEV
jgi:8-oxo-dGTP diphosphatase